MINKTSLYYWASMALTFHAKHIIVIHIVVPLLLLLLLLWSIALGMMKVNLLWGVIKYLHNTCTWLSIFHSHHLVCSAVWPVFLSGLHVLCQLYAFDILKLFTPSDNCSNFDVVFCYTLLTYNLVSSIHYTTITTEIFE